MIGLISKYRHVWTTVIVSIGVSFYAWISTGLKPFSPASYISVVIPVIILATIFVTSAALSPSQIKARDYYRQQAGDFSTKTVLPWVIIFLCGIGLEAIGLVLGGRSVVVPTLSTMIDYLLITHIGRFILFLIWLEVGWMPVNKFINRNQRDQL